MEATAAGAARTGARNIGLVVADGIIGLESALSASFSGTPLQQCITHIKRNLLARVRAADKLELAEDLRQVFRPENLIIVPKPVGSAGR